jgi:pimeloyl-ACP methyl ester carboxylesterase
MVGGVLSADARIGWTRHARVGNRIVRVAAWVVLVVVSACGGGASLGPGAIQKAFHVGGRSLYLECAGKGSPTVVMDAGLGNTHETWQSVAPAVRKLTRTCTYDRANLGKSDSASKPRTSAEVVADLHRLLEAAGIRPPYLLVGHSFGGLDVRLFAAQHPTEVSGIVLVDPTPTTFLDGECALVSTALCQELRDGWDPENNPEGLDYVKSSAQVEAAANMPRVPVIVLAATSHQQEAITDPDIEKRIEALWRQSELELANESHGRLIVISSGHDIQLLKPKAVISAVGSLLAHPASQ